MIAATVAEATEAILKPGAKWGWLMLIGGIVAAWFYYHVVPCVPSPAAPLCAGIDYHTPVTDFAIWSPTVLGMSMLEYQLIWWGVEPFERLAANPNAPYLFYVVLIFNALLVG